MSIPFGYNNNFKEYFEDALRFFTTYKWVYQSPNTHILTDKVFNKFPSDWLVFLKCLNNVELGSLRSAIEIMENSPKSLVEFFRHIDKLKPMIVRKERSSVERSPKNSKIGQKKYHEILSLGPLIHEICEKHGTKSVMDIGSGLGYLSSLLYENYNYKVFGIEGCEEKVSAAEKLKKSETKVKFVHHYITQESASSLKALNEENSMDSTCIAGLHACADLSVIILDLFLKLPFAKALVMMPCCYHRLQVDKDGNFENFPTSHLLKNLFAEFEANDFIKVPFLRLACQRIYFDSKLSDEEANNCLYRAILQEAAETGNCQVKRLKRKSGKNLKDLDAYLRNLTSTHELIGGDLSSTHFQNIMREIWTRHKDDSKLVKALRLFQSSIQGVCENLVLLDRVAFLKEKGVDSYIEKVTDECISPRCYALVATKP